MGGAGRAGRAGRLLGFAPIRVPGRVPGRAGGPSPRPRPVVRVPGRGPESSALPSVTCARLLCRCDMVQAVYQGGWGSAAVAAAGPGPKPRCFGAAGAMRLRPRIPSSVAALLRLCCGPVAAEDSDSHAALAQAVQGRRGPGQIPLSSQHDAPRSPLPPPLPPPWMCRAAPRSHQTSVPTKQGPRANRLPSPWDAACPSPGGRNKRGFKFSGVREV